jgi:hypothetical protein
MSVTIEVNKKIPKYNQNRVFCLGMENQPVLPAVSRTIERSSFFCLLANKEKSDRNVKLSALATPEKGKRHAKTPTLSTKYKLKAYVEV